LEHPPLLVQKGLEKKRENWKGLKTKCERRVVRQTAYRKRLTAVRS
jgi:hypothetical protein